MIKTSDEGKEWRPCKRKNMDTNIDDTQYCKQCEAYARQIERLKRALKVDNVVIKQENDEIYKLMAEITKLRRTQFSSAGELKKGMNTRRRKSL